MNYVLLGTIALFSISTLVAKEPHYIGSDKCAKMCHKSEKKGAQYGQWKGSAHAKAFTTLGTEESKKVAEEAGVTGDPQKAPECLRCHVTGFDAKKEVKEKTCTYDEGVGCEGCHGPGSEYRKLTIMKNHDKAVAAGLIEQTEASCLRCHNEEAPNYKPFNYEESFKKVTHPIPGKAVKK